MVMNLPSASRVDDDDHDAHDSVVCAKFLLSPVVVGEIVRVQDGYHTRLG